LEHTPPGRLRIKREPSGGCGRWRRKWVKLVEEDNWETVVGGARDFGRDVVKYDNYELM